MKEKNKKNYLQNISSEPLKGTIEDINEVFKRRKLENLKCSRKGPEKEDASKPQRLRVSKR